MHFVLESVKDLQHCDFGGAEVEARVPFLTRDNYLRICIVNSQTKDRNTAKISRLTVPN